MYSDLLTQLISHPFCLQQFDLSSSSILSAVTGLPQTHLNFHLIEVVCKSYCTQLGTSLAMRNYHGSIFPYVSFSLGQVLLVLSYLLGAQSYLSMYWFFYVWGLLHCKS
jgi:hypothetical protein